MTFMTRLLEEAVERARVLPAPEQDAIAAMILEEIAGKPDLWDAIKRFRTENDLSDLRVEEVFSDLGGRVIP
jgi:hypothetical protein